MNRVFKTPPAFKNNQGEVEMDAVNEGDENFEGASDG